MRLYRICGVLLLLVANQTAFAEEGLRLAAQFTFGAPAVRPAHLSLGFAPPSGTGVVAPVREVVGLDFGPNGRVLNAADSAGTNKEEDHSVAKGLGVAAVVAIVVVVGVTAWGVHEIGSGSKSGGGSSQ